MNWKFVIPITGPLLTYRLKIIERTSPEIIDFILFVTDGDSYKHYKDFHDVFKFIIIDEYRDDFSLENEFILNADTEEQFLDEFKNTYNHTPQGLCYPWEFHRFIFKYLAQENILNFAITQTDYIFRNDKSLVIDFFNNIEAGTLYASIIGVIREHRPHLKTWAELAPKFPGLDLTIDQDLTGFDGYFRGYHFRNLSDMEEYFNLWNHTIQSPIQRYKLKHSSTCCFTDFCSDWVMNVFSRSKNYLMKHLHQLSAPRKAHHHIGYHVTKPEDTLVYIGPRRGFENFNTDDRSSIKNFIKNNKEELIKYYRRFGIRAEVTDTHVFTYYE